MTTMVVGTISVHEGFFAQMWKKWIGLIWGIALAVPCAISLNMPNGHALPFGVTVLVMGIIIPNVELGMNRFVQGAIVGVLLSLPTTISFAWWPLSAIAASVGIGIVWLNERLSPLLLRKRKLRIEVPAFRLRTLFAGTTLLALLLAWHHHANGVRSRLRREGIALQQRWYELRPNQATIDVQCRDNGNYRINGQDYDDQQAVAFLVKTLNRLRPSGIDATEVELNSTTNDPYEQNRIWVLQQHLEANGVAAEVSFSNP